MLRSKCQGIPSQTVQNLVRAFGGADLLNALVEADIRTISLPESKLTALIIPVPDLEPFNPKPPFGNVTTYTWGLVHGTTAHSDRSRSPTLRRPGSALSHADLPGFPRWRGPMGSAVRASQTMSNPQSSRPWQIT